MHHIQHVTCCSNDAVYVHLNRRVLSPALLPYLVHQAAIVAAEQVHLTRVNSDIRVLSWGVLQADTWTDSLRLPDSSILFEPQQSQHAVSMACQTTGHHHRCSRLIKVHTLMSLQSPNRSCLRNSCHLLLFWLP
jgi:hypothetical protein